MSNTKPKEWNPNNFLIAFYLIKGIQLQRERTPAIRWSLWAGLGDNGKEDGNRPLPEPSSGRGSHQPQRGTKRKKRNHIKAGVLISSEIYKNDSLWVKMDLNMYCLKSCRTKTNAVKRLLSTSWHQTEGLFVPCRCRYKLALQWL